MLGSIFAFLLGGSCLISGTLAQQLGTLHRRTYVYVGQTYTPLGDSMIAADQMYVERLTPAEVTQPLPILFIHGLGMTGTNFLNTPDGRLGWADYFLSKGYELYIVDQPARARSPWQPTVDGVLSPSDTVTIESHFTAVERFKLWPQSVLHTQWPGNGSVGDPVFDEFFASTVPSLNSSTEEAVKIKHAGSLLLDQIGPVILLTHSQAGEFGWILADSRPDQVKAIVALEPYGPPFINAIFPPFTPNRIYGLTDIPVAYDPPITAPSDIARVVVSESPGFTCFQQAKPARKLINLVDIPVLVVTSEASYHAIYDNCSVDYLRAAGVSVDHVRLGDVGIHGNAHMFFMEKNGIQIADEVIKPWIAKIRA
ncbi:Alpha/beta hydrolase family-domain-containing protein [Mycena rosella]|uniref:Alpha/beta hydrolase family-domain-containing protein n=1 Tax=Mycena rosella TaxID=1033263 RepID=A0AAD7GAM8_MYCRO|nr:Alpha/beta hydrolase family-domain-containing protein [Mycena rosella]